ncbi:PAAR domain-containing protein [Pseudomonas sp. TWP3-1]|uniref:PAAR domain-containing protein n=1 Tax=unclassified Pseudomonas TaxID=196821 RepID=UPI003CF32A67
MSGKPAARATDATSCPAHAGQTITAGSPNVFFDGLPAARLGDPASCGSAISSNTSATVFINGKNAAIQGSLGSHGDVIVGGSGTVIIGHSGGGAPISPVLPINLGFDEQFTLLDADGEPVPDFAYKITTASGIVFRGVTNELGLTRRVSTRASEQLHLEPDDLA